MKNLMLCCSLLALFAITIVGCGGNEGEGSSGTPQPTANNGHEGHNHDHGIQLVSYDKYCGACGHGTDSADKECAACEDGDAVCKKCDLHEGSQLCCLLEEPLEAGKFLCGKCGHVAGTDKCCKVGADVCDKCKLHKGSPLCCKLNPQSENAGD